MMDVVEVTYYDKPVPCFAVTGAERRKWVDADSDTSWVIQRYDRTDEVHYWYCLTCRSTGCECARVAKVSIDLIREEGT